MARDYLTLGPTPCGEDCQQLGPNYDEREATREMQIYIAQLRRQFPTWEQDGIYFRTKGFQHDAGTYHEVVVWFDANDDKACHAAYNVENNLPEYWDDQACAHMPTLNPEFPQSLGVHAS